MIVNRSIAETSNKSGHFYSIVMSMGGFSNITNTVKTFRRLVITVVLSIGLNLASLTLNFMIPPLYNS